MPDGDLNDNLHDLPHDNLHDEIARIESEIEALADTLERCRKFGLAARIAIAAGALWLLAVFVGVVSSEAAALLAAVSAVIGGIVLSGSNAGTAEQAEAALSDAEARRAELIGTMDLRVIDGGRDSLISPESGIRKPSASWYKAGLD